LGLLFKTNGSFGLDLCATHHEKVLLSYRTAVALASSAHCANVFACLGQCEVALIILAIDAG